MIEIVTHCWNPPGLDIYSEMLKHQLASIEQHARKPVMATVCHSREDKKTVDVIAGFSGKLSNQMAGWVNPVPLLPRNLFRRAIGRNYAALKSKADVVWFTDCDMLFGPDCLAEAERLTLTTNGLTMPAEVQISFDNDNEFAGEERPHHHVGYRYIESHRDNPLPAIDPSQFGGPWTGPCIGGVQIVPGKIARKYGYLNGSDFLSEPIDVSLGFRSCKGDVKYRRQLKDAGVVGPTKVNIPNCYRIRHLRDGRSILQSGEEVGKAAW